MSLKEFVFNLTFSVPVVLGTGIILALFKIKVLTPLRKTLTLYLFSALIIDCLSRYVGLVLGENNLVFVPLAALIDLGFVIYVCFYHLKSSVPTIISILLILATSLAIYEIWTNIGVDPKAFNTYARICANLIILIICLHYIFGRIKENKAYPINAMNLSLITFSFFTISSLFYLPLNFLINIHTAYKFYFFLGNLVLTVLFYTLIIRMIWRNGKIH